MVVTEILSGWRCEGTAKSRLAGIIEGGVGSGGKTYINPGSFITLILIATTPIIFRRPALATPYLADTISTFYRCPRQLLDFLFTLCLEPLINRLDSVRHKLVKQCIVLHDDTMIVCASLIDAPPSIEVLREGQTESALVRCTGEADLGIFIIG